VGWAQLRSRAAAAIAFCVSGFLVSVVVAGCSSQSRSLASFADGGVKVDVRVARHAGHEVLIVQFRPEKSGFHLYSKDLVSAQVRGLGIATRVRLVAGLEADGTQFASRQTQQLRVAELGVSIPVYPNGSVAISTPTRPDGSSTGRIEISYGACSDTVCLRPVLSRPVEFAIPTDMKSTNGP
jgi:hypothetical protein